MTVAAAQLPAELHAYVRRFAVRRRWQRLVQAGGVAAILTIVWAGGWWAADRLLGLPAAVRWTALLINAAIIIVVIARPVAALFRAVDVPRVSLEVERRQPRFRQRLSTLTSRVLGPAPWRGSNELLGALAEEVTAETRRRSPARLLPWTPALRPWLLALLGLSVLIALSRWSWLDLPSLAQRYAAPWAEVPPVTTTRLQVAPGDIEISEGDTLTIRAQAIRLGDVAPVLHVRSPGQPAHDQPMAAMADGSFEARIADVDRDLRYEVSGGDARSATFAVRILPKPAIAAFHVHFDYPAYTRLPGRELTNTSGYIEAPAGTEVRLSIEATQPLKLAMMTIGGEAVRMAPVPGRPTVHAATFTVREDQRYTIRMASDREVSGAFRGGVIRAIADRAPVVRLRVRRAGGPEPVTVGYDAVDDYGLARLDAEMTLRRRSGAIAQRTAPIALVPGTRSAHGTFRPDLAALDAAAGDRLEVVVRAEDHAGQFDVSVPVEIVVESVPPPDASPPEPAEPVEPSLPPAPNPPAPPLDPPGYDAALEAYFDALRRQGE